MRKVLLAVIILSVLVAACGPSDTGTGNMFAGGDKGVLLSFQPGAPPADYVTGGAVDPFSVTLIMENRGEFDIAQDDIWVELKGVDYNDFAIDLNELRIHPDSDLDGVRMNPDTGEIEISAAAYANFDLEYQPDLPGNNVFEMLVEVCYPYRTRAIAELCVKRNLLDRTEKVCRITGPKNVQHSGAPLKVINFQEYSAGSNKVRFEFDLIKSTQTQGKIYELDTDCAFDNSTSNAQMRLENKVKVTVATNMSGLDCRELNISTSGDTAVGWVKLASGSKTITCTQVIPDGERQDKIKFINIYADYDFQDSVQTSVLIKPSGEALG